MALGFSRDSHLRVTAPHAAHRDLLPGSSYGSETTKRSGGPEFSPSAGSESGLSNCRSYASWGHPALTLQASGVGEECSHMHSTESPAGSASPEHQVLANGSGTITDQKSQNSSLLQSDRTWLENGREKACKDLSDPADFHCTATYPSQQYSLPPLPPVLLPCLLSDQNSHKKLRPSMNRHRTCNWVTWKSARGTEELKATDTHTHTRTTVITNS